MARVVYPSQILGAKDAQAYTDLTCALVLRGKTKAKYTQIEANTPIACTYVHAIRFVKRLYL